MLASCASMQPLMRSPETAPAGPTHIVLATDPTVDTAIEMILDGRYADASKLLDQLIVMYESARDARHAAESIFWLGYCKEKSGNPADAAKYYRRVMERYPATDAARNAQDRLDGLGQT